MLNKVKCLAYKTKINVKIKAKIKIVYVLILSIFLVSRKIEQKNFKKSKNVHTCWMHIHIELLHFFIHVLFYVAVACCCCMLLLCCMEQCTHVMLYEIRKLMLTFGSNKSLLNRLKKNALKSLRLQFWRWKIAETYLA